MLKKILVGILLVTVLGAAGTALAYQANSQETDSSGGGIPPLASEGFEASLTPAEQQIQASPGINSSQDTEKMLGAAWQETGTIVDIDPYGFQFQLQAGDQVYIELGPPDFWQNQVFALQIGQTATVAGTESAGTVHAESVTLADGSTLQLRSENGQPLWSGAASADQGQGAGIADGDHTPDPQVQVDEWVTLQGEILSFQGGSMTMASFAGEVISFQTGQPRFFSSQGITFQVGDEIIVVGFYQNGQFMAGDITQVATGLKVLLRDPNGRPLWAGPGNSSGNGNGGQGSGGAGKRQ